MQIANSKIANDSIIHYSNSSIRRVDFSIATSYDDEPDKVRAVLTELLDAHPLVLQEEGKTPVVHVKEFRDNDFCTPPVLGAPIKIIGRSISISWTP